MQDIHCAELLGALVHGLVSQYERELRQMQTAPFCGSCD